MKPEELVEKAQLLSVNLGRIRKARSLPQKVQDAHQQLLQLLIEQSYDFCGTLFSEAAEGFISDQKPNMEEIAEQTCNAYPVALRDLEQGYLDGFGQLLLNCRTQLRADYAALEGFERIGYAEAFKEIAEILG